MTEATLVPTGIPHWQLKIASATGSIATKWNGTSIPTRYFVTELIKSHDEKRYRLKHSTLARSGHSEMVFSANIPFEVHYLGGYHARVPPPLHQFQPDLPGIVGRPCFFLFLFCMGAAIPFSLGGKIEKGYRGRLMGRDLLIRFGGLALFAIVSQHARPWVMNVDEGAQWPLALLAMIGMVLLFASPSSGWWSRHRQLMRIIGLLILIALFGALHYFDRVTFRLQRFDIIIMVLANNALAGALLYLLHRKYKQTLWISFALLCAFFLSGRAGDNWIAALSLLTCWLLSWNYLKYLLVTAGLACSHCFASPSSSIAEVRRVVPSLGSGKNPCWPTSQG